MRPRQPREICRGGRAIRYREWGKRGAAGAFFRSQYNAATKQSRMAQCGFMARQLVECVPNFSEGRDAAKIDSIVQAILTVPDVVLLDRESDTDHNRCVLTFVGPPAAVADAAFRGVEKAVALIDLTKHRGAHPRIGAADVVPFIPIEGVTLEECVRLAERVANEIWNKLRVPVYLYESAARRPDRVNLENRSEEHTV